jgi:hypothetical protein
MQFRRQDLGAIGREITDKKANVVRKELGLPEVQCLAPGIRGSGPSS